MTIALEPIATTQEQPAMHIDEASTAPADPVIASIIGQLDPDDPAPRPTPMDELDDDGLPMRFRKSTNSANLKNVIGNRLIAAREMNGWSQGDAAKALGFTNGTQLCLWESGSRVPPLHLISRVSEVFGVSTDWLLGLDDAPERDSATAARGAVIRRMSGLLEQHATQIVDTLLQTQKFDPTPLLRSTGFCGLVLELVDAVGRYRERNQDAFDETPASALLVRTATDARAAAEKITKAMDRADFRMTHEMNKARKALSEPPKLPVARRL